jgi:hypothetical protein
MTDSRLDHALDYRFLIMPFRVDYLDLRGLERPKTKIMMNLGNPDEAFALSFIPNDGVGLARQEFNRPTRNLVPVQWTSTCPSAMDTSVKTTAPARHADKGCGFYDHWTSRRCLPPCVRPIVPWSLMRPGGPAVSQPKSARRSRKEPFYDLDAPVMRRCSAEVPIPYAKHLQDAALPQLGAIVRTVHLMLRASS